MGEGNGEGWRKVSKALVVKFRFAHDYPTLLRSPFLGNNRYRGASVQNRYIQ